MNLETTKQRVKAVLGRIVFGTRLHRLLLSDSAVVVAFHRVNDDLPNYELTCGVESFESYCRFFARYFDVVPLSHLAKARERRTAGRTARNHL